VIISTLEHLAAGRSDLNYFELHDPHFAETSNLPHTITKLETELEPRHVGSGV